MKELEIRHQNPHNAYEWKQEGLQRPQREDVCVYKRDQPWGDAVEEGGGFVQGYSVRNRWRMWGMLRKWRLRPSACSLLPVLVYSGVPFASVCRLSAGASGVNAGRISLSVRRGHWMAAFHGQQKHWLRVRADLRLLRKYGLDLELDELLWRA